MPAASAQRANGASYAVTTGNAAPLRAASSAAPTRRLIRSAPRRPRGRERRVLGRARAAYAFTGDPEARGKILQGVGYYDAGGALDVADVLDQVRWFKAQGLVKGDSDPAAMLDTQFLPTR